MEELIATIEALLFAHGEPLSIGRLAKVLGASEEDIRKAIAALAESYRMQNRGLSLVENGDEVQLGTAPAFAAKVEQLFREEFRQDLTPAALETLAIVTYRAPISRPEVEAIRGVNSSFILRSLMMRGLITRDTDPERPHLWLYRPTFEFLRLLGITSAEELPDFETLSQELNKLEQSQVTNTQL